MNRVEALLADLRSRGIEFETDGVRLRWRPAFMVNEMQAEQIKTHKAALIALLKKPNPDLGPMCLSCRWPLDSCLRCPKCFDRRCENCGKNTGSYFVQRCVACCQIAPADNDSASNSSQSGRSPKVGG